MTERFAQLTYTSFEPEDGSRGGWQVRETSDDLTVSEREFALSYVPAEMRLVKPLSKYPSALETRTLPRRLLYLRLPGDPAFYIHSCPAGTDGSGREGNIFTHILVDREADAMQRERTTHRPIELWRSARWLTPYGMGEIGSARIAEHLPPVPDAGAKNRERTARFIAARADRLDGLGALLDAAAIAAEGGPRLVILADDVDDGAAWLAAVTMLAGSGPALSLSFSTLESSVDLRTKGPMALLSVVLREEARAVISSLPAGVVVVDPADQAAPSGGRWTPLAGTPFAEGTWSRLLSVIGRAGARVLGDRMLAIDELSAINADLGVTRPDWALAVALAEEPGLGGDWEVLARVILQSTPLGRLPADTKRAFRTLLKEHATAPVDLSGLIDDGLISVTNEDLLLDLYTVYLAGVLSSADRLLGPEAVHVRTWPSLGRPELAERLLTALGPPLTKVLADAVDHVERSVRALRVLDLLFRSGLKFDPSRSVLGGLLTEGVRGLESPEGEVLDRVGPLSAELRKAANVTPTVSEALPSQPRVGNAASKLAPAEDLILHPGSKADAEKVSAAVAALSQAPGSGAPPGDWTWKVLRQVGHGTVWSLDDLVALAEGIGPWDHVDLTAEACAAVLDAGLSEPAARLAELVVEHNEAAGRVVDDYQADLLWLSRVLGDRERWHKVADPCMAARVLRLGLGIGLDRNRVEEEQWLQWAPALVVAAAGLVGLTPVHLDHPQVLHELDGLDVVECLAPVVGAAGALVCDWVRDAMASGPALTRAVVLAAWRSAEGSTTRGAIPADLLTLGVKVGAGRRPLAEAAIASFAALGPERRLWPAEVVMPMVEPRDKGRFTAWLTGVMQWPTAGPSTLTSTVKEDQ